LITYELAGELHEDCGDLTIEFGVFVVANGLEKLFKFGFENRLSFFARSFGPESEGKDEKFKFINF
jgi:hypothetical protein